MSLLAGLSQQAGAIEDHDENAAAHGLYVYNAADFGTISATDPVSHLAIQAAIDAAHAAGGGTVVLPPQSILLGATLVPKSGVTVAGTAPRSSSAQVNWDLGLSLVDGTILSYPAGYVFTQDTSGQVGGLPHINNFNVRDIGFADSAGGISCGALDHLGICGSEFTNLWFSNISGICLRIHNFQHNYFARLTGFNCGQWMDLCNDVSALMFSGGNSVFMDTYFFHGTAAATNHAIKIYNGNSIAAGSEMNRLTFYNTQVNRFSTAAKATAHVYVNGGVGGKVSHTQFFGNDMEGDADYAYDLINVIKFIIDVNQIPVPTAVNGSVRIVTSAGVACTGWNDNLVVTADTTSAPQCQVFGALKTNSATNLRVPGAYFNKTTSKYEMRFGKYEQNMLTPAGLSGDSLFLLTFGANYGGFDLSGNMKLKMGVITKTGASWTVGNGQSSSLILVTESVSDSTGTLYTAPSTTGELVTIKNAGTKVVTIVGTSSQTIDGAASLTLNPKDCAKLRSDGTNYIIEAIYRA